MDKNILETVKLTCREINGENRIFTKTGSHEVSLYADVPDDNCAKLIRKHFIISNVGDSDEFLNARYYAEKFLEYCYCGYVYNVTSK